MKIKNMLISFGLSLIVGLYSLAIAIYFDYSYRVVDATILSLVCCDLIYRSMEEKK